MARQYTNKTVSPIIDIGIDGIRYYPSESYYSNTGSAPSDNASYNIIIPRTISENLITNSGLQPYIKFELISGSRGAGQDVNNLNQAWEYYIRFYTASHFDSEQLFTNNGDDDIGGIPKKFVSGSRVDSGSLYATASGNAIAYYRDIEYTKGQTALEIRNAIFNIITGSTQYLTGHLSTSKHQDEEDPSTGFINNYTCSLHYIHYRGGVSEPTFYTGSLHPDLGTKKQTKSDGSGSENMPIGPSLIRASASMFMGIDNLDNISFKMSIGTSSLAQSGSSERTILYASGGIGGQGRVGFGTKNPKTKFDIKTDGFKVRSEDGVRELIFEQDGRLSAKKYSGTSASESIGGIIQLSYTPGTFDSPAIAREEETIGTINWVDESLNKLTSGLSADDPDQKYATSASVAQITSTVKFADPGVGVIGNLEFKVSPVPTAETLDARRSKAKSQLTTFMEINPLLTNAPVLFPHPVSCSSTVYANDLILDYDSLPTSNPSNKGQVYRNGSNQLFISAG